MELPRQKGFYDSRRQFQGRDDPRPNESQGATPPTGLPRGQLIAGAILLLLIVVAFIKFAPPEQPVTRPPTAQAH